MIRAPPIKRLAINEQLYIGVQSSYTVYNWNDQVTVASLICYKALSAMST